MKKIESAKIILIVKVLLTAIFTVAFLLVFSLCGGWTLVMGKIGNVKNFSHLDFEVHFIDVGQGDCAFIRFPDKTNLLIDAGPAQASKNVVNYLQDLFKQEGISKIDNFLATHQDSDHIGGAVAVFEAFEVERVFRPKVYSYDEYWSLDEPQNYKVVSTLYYSNFIEAVYNEGCEICFNYAGNQWSGNNFSVKFLSPTLNGYSANNDYSAVIKITYKERSFLFTGDAESGGTETEVMQNYASELDCDVLKVAHHGAKNATSENFLSLVTPDIAIISVGKNSYGHPSDEVLERLKAQNCQVIQTNLDGSVALGVDGNNKILIGGQNNHPKIDLALTIVVYMFCVLLTWGINVKKISNKKIK